MPRCLPAGRESGGHSPSAAAGVDGLRRRANALNTPFPRGEVRSGDGNRRVPTTMSRPQLLFDNSINRQPKRTSRPRSACASRLDSPVSIGLFSWDPPNRKTSKSLGNSRSVFGESMMKTRRGAETSRKSAGRKSGEFLEKYANFALLHFRTQKFFGTPRTAEIAFLSNVIR
jgi:hypothetical protein